MSQFERIYQTDPSRESHNPRELHPSIELSDEEYLSKLSPLYKSVMRMLDYIEENPVEPVKKQGKDAKDKSKPKSKTVTRVKKKL